MRSRTFAIRSAAISSGRSVGSLPPKSVPATSRPSAVWRTWRPGVITSPRLQQGVAQAIAYRTLTNYLVSTSNYAAARTYSIKAAKDLSYDTNQVKNAWNAVGVGAQMAVEIVNYVQEFCHCEEGICELFDAFNAKREITLDDLRKAAS